MQFPARLGASAGQPRRKSRLKDIELHKISEWLRGIWQGGRELSLLEGLSALSVPLYVCERDGALVFGQGGSVGGAGIAVRAIAPTQNLLDAGDPSFLQDHGLRYPYYTGAMANGISSEAIVEAMGRAGMLGFFGAAGLSPARIEAACQRLTASMAGLPFGCNLINFAQ